MRRGSFLVVLAMVASVGGVFMALNAVPVPDVENREIKNTSFICLADVADGECTELVAAAQFSAGGSRRIFTPIANISPNLINAVIAAEDRSFFQHNGVDAWGIIRAAYRSVAGSASRQGGSTITQQYVKMVYLSNEGTLQRKFNEAAIAMKIEREMTKTEILEAYLNEAPFGRGTIGVQAAAQTYFGKNVSDLTVADAAYLAGLLRAPSYADEPTNPEKPEENREAKRRRGTVLNAMYEMGYITAEERDTFDAEPFEDHVSSEATSSTGAEVYSDFSGVGGDYIVEWVRQLLVDPRNEELPTYVGQSKLFGGGIKVYLEIDPDLQFLAKWSTNKYLEKIPGPSAAMMTVDEAGRVLAMIGGQDWNSLELNLALGKAGGGSGRQPGSTMKPVALAAYVAAGNSIESQYYSPPIIQMKDPVTGDPIINPATGEPLEFKNYEETGSSGSITVEKATWYSSNTVYVQMMQELGMDKFIEMAQTLGIVAEQKRELGAVLGTSEVSLLEIAVAYATLGNHGERTTPHVIRRIEDASGEVIYDVATDERYKPVAALDRGVADTVAHVLTGTMHSGTGKNAEISKPSAGKTGTTTDNKDAWFAGFSCGLTSVFWMGYPEVDEATNSLPQMIDSDGKTVTGGRQPAMMWGAYMEHATKDRADCKIEDVNVGTNVRPEPLPLYGPTTTTTIPPEVAPPEGTDPDAAAASNTPVSQPGIPAANGGDDVEGEPGA